MKMIRLCFVGTIEWVKSLLILFFCRLLFIVQLNLAFFDKLISQEMICIKILQFLFSE